MEKESTQPVTGGFNRLGIALGVQDSMPEIPNKRDFMELCALSSPPIFYE